MYPLPTPPMICGPSILSVHFRPVSDGIPTCKHSHPQSVSFPCYLSEVLTSPAAIHLAYLLVSLTISADQRGTRGHVHPYHKESRKEENRFFSSLEILKEMDL